MVLYRNGPFQVQLFTFQPNVLITPHRHGHIDTIVHYVTGEVFFFVNGKEILPRGDFATDANGLALHELDLGRLGNNGRDLLRGNLPQQKFPNEEIAFPIPGRPRCFLAKQRNA